MKKEKKKNPKYLHFQSALKFSAIVSVTGHQLDKIVPSTSFTHSKCKSCHCCNTDPCSIPRYRRSPCPREPTAHPSSTPSVLPKTRKRNTKTLLAGIRAQKLILSLGLYLPSRSPSLSGVPRGTSCARSRVEPYLPLALRVRRGSRADSSLQSSEDFRKAAKRSALPGRFPLRFNSI